jgi:hypothetical protein
VLLNIQPRTQTGVEANGLTRRALVTLSWARAKCAMIGGLIRQTASNSPRDTWQPFRDGNVLGVSTLWSAGGEPVGLQILAAVKIEI